VAAVPDMWSVGISVPTLAGEQVVARWDDVEVLLITNASSPEHRQLAQRLAHRAKTDTPFNTPAYTTADTDPEVRIFVARRAGRGIGLAVLRPRPRWGWWSWDDWDEERRPSTGVAPLTSWTVEIIWTLGQAQQKGLAHGYWTRPPASWISRSPHSAGAAPSRHRARPSCGGCARRGSGCRISRRPLAVSRQLLSAVGHKP